MARLQDFQPVTPTDSDNLLVVQSTGQGLATFGSTVGAKMNKANPTGTGSLSLNRKAGTTVGVGSVAVGYQPTASGNYSHAEGLSTTASGEYSHSEGYQTTSEGLASHAEGRENTSSGYYSHAEGSGNVASGFTAHAEGYNTIAQRMSQHVFGEYNSADTGGTGPTGKGTYVEIVGNGTSDSSRSNARTLDWSGNEVLAGDLTINGSNGVVQIVMLASVEGSSEKTYTIPDSIYNAYGIYILALANGFGVGGVYILRINNNGNAIVFTTLVASSYATITSVSKKQFKITTGNAAFNPRLTRIA